MYLQPNHSVIWQAYQPDGVIPTGFVRLARRQRTLQAHASAQTTGLGAPQAIPVHVLDSLKARSEMLPNG